MGEFGDKPLLKMAVAFDDLADTVNSKEVDLELGAFSIGCSQVSPLFGFLGFAFKIAEKDFVSKVEDLKEASKSVTSLESLLDLDVGNDCVKTNGSHSRNLLRVKRGLDMVRVLFENIIAEDDESIRMPASKAYDQILGPHHGWAIRAAVSAGFYTLPTRKQLLEKFNEDENSAKVNMRKYITSSAVVIHYVEKLFLSRKLGIDW